MKLRFLSNVMFKEGYPVNVLGMNVIKGRVYDIPDSLALYLIHEYPNEWRQVDYKGVSERPDINVKHVETIIGRKVEDLKPFRTETNNTDEETESTNEVGEEEEVEEEEIEVEEVEVEKPKRRGRPRKEDK